MSKATALKPKPATNASGVNPLEFKVVVRPIVDDVGYLKSKTSDFKLIKAIETEERDKHAAMEGELIAISSTAFTYDENAVVPMVGATVMFARYSGITFEGPDGKQYRLMNDKDVVGVRA